MSLNPCPNPACGALMGWEFVKVERVRIESYGEYGAALAERTATFATIACSLKCAIVLSQAQIDRDPEPISPHQEWLTS